MRDSTVHVQLYYYVCSPFTAVYRVLEELKYKHYSSQMERYLQLFHHRPVAASLYRKVSLGGGGLICTILIDIFEPPAV